MPVVRVSDLPPDLFRTGRPAGRAKYTAIADKVVTWLNNPNRGDDEIYQLGPDEGTDGKHLNSIQSAIRASAKKSRWSVGFRNVHAETMGRLQHMHNGTTDEPVKMFVRCLGRIKVDAVTTDEDVAVAASVDVPRPLSFDPEYSGPGLTNHALERLQERKIPVKRIYEVIRDPEITMPSPREGCRLYKCSDVTAVVDETSNKIVTVYGPGEQGEYAA